MLVLSAIVLLTTMGVEFAYNTNVNAHLAQNDYDRLRASYLAKSAFNFMLLELKFDKTFRQVVQQQNLGQYLGQNAQLPLCQQFPMSTGLIRAVFTGGGLEGLMGGGGGEEGGAAGEGEEAAPEPSPEIEEKRKDVSLGQEQAAEEFLSFEGDFEGECFDETTKINLNAFAELPTTAPEGQASPFDQYRQFLFRFLSRPQYEDLFKAADVRVADVVTNIGDWIDTNADINPMVGGGGSERAAYDRMDVSYAIRNGKLLTLLEAYLIDGVVDEWFAPLMDQFTIYGDGKIDVCTTTPDIVEGLIRRYVDATPSLPPLRLEDPEEMGRLVGAVTEACGSGATGDQLKGQISQALDAAIGAVSAGTPAATTTPTTAGQQGPGQQAQQAGGGFGDYITTDRRFFSLTLTGQVADTTVRLKTVVDIKENDPKKWKYLYWRIY